MAEKIKVVKAGKLDKEGLKKLGKSFLISLAGAGIIFLGDITNIADFGSLEVYISTFLPFLVNTLRKFLLPYTSKA
jgi:hypothetical protein